MKVIKKFKNFLVRLFFPDKDIRIARNKAIGEDLRKIAITSIGVGSLGLIISNNNMTTGEALTIIWFGVIIWLIGIILTGAK